jgi:hypothetical protein
VEVVHSVATSETVFPESAECRTNAAQQSGYDDGRSARWRCLIGSDRFGMIGGRSVSASVPRRP